MNTLLVEPDYYSRYPPLGLMKLASLYRSYGNDIIYVRGLNNNINKKIRQINITSLFTYAWKPVHDAIDFYHNMFPEAEITVGGIYATLMPEHIQNAYPFVKVFKGLHPKAEEYLPSYDILKDVDKWKDWKKSIVFTSRGCIRNCPFCVVPKIEGKFRANKNSILPLIHPNHKEVVIWDNNFLASPYAKKMLKEMRDYGIKPDFNQGLDARLMDEEIAGLLADLKPETIHFAYDFVGERKSVKKAIDLLDEAGYKKKYIIFYMLYNFYDYSLNYGDTPEDFLIRLKDLMQWGASAYPMRYIPLNALEKNSFISPLWTPEQLEMIADARRVLGYGGAFVPYRGFINKILDATNFEEAMELRPTKIKLKKEIINKQKSNSDLVYITPTSTK
ncbi:MAG: hypothetical protein RXO36_05540 [Candidatus Nanopusillus acidilobi]